MNQTLSERIGLTSNAANQPRFTASASVDMSLVANNIFKELQVHTKMLRVIAGRLALQTLEQIVEARRSEDNQTKLLEKIAENTGGKEANSTKEVDTSMIGKYGTALAIALGGILATIRGYWQIFRTFTPTTLAGKIVNAVSGVITRTITASAELVRSIMNSRIGGMIDKVIDVAKVTFNWLMKPFQGLIGLLKGPTLKVFESVTSWARGFGGLVSKFLGIFSKIFWPLQVLVVGWNTVKEAIKGYENGGWWEAILGGIKGFFNTLIFMPLDFLKSAVSWVAEKLGFESVSKALDSFSFENIFTKLVDTVGSFLANVGSWIAKKIDSVLNIFGLGSDPETPEEIAAANAKQKSYLESKVAETDRAIALQEKKLATTPNMAPGTRQKTEAGIIALKKNRVKLLAEIKNLEQPVTDSTPQQNSAYTSGAHRADTIAARNEQSRATLAELGATDAIIRNDVPGAMVSNLTRDVEVIRAEAMRPSQSQPTVISAPTTNVNNNTTISAPRIVRNQDSSYHWYNSGKYSTLMP